MTGMQRCIAVSVLVGVGWIAAVESASGQPSTTRPAARSSDPWLRYRVLTDRNIFLRDRSRPVYRPAPRTRYTPPPAPAPAGYVLAGTVRDEKEVLAFFENTGTGEIVRVSLGGKVGSYTVEKITLDGVDVADGTAGRKESVTVGAGLAGGYAQTRSPLALSPTSRPAAAPPTGQPTAGREPPKAEPPVPAGDMAALLERMRQRRQQQLGQ